MLTLSKPISAGQAQAYHKSEFANAKENYYTEGERVRGEWQGQLAARYGLRGEVNEEQFARLSEGQHPATGEALIRRQQAREYINDKGETARTMEHLAGWDATFSTPKSVSLTALVGGDSRVREALILAFWFGPATAVKFGPLGQHWLGFMDGATEA